MSKDSIDEAIECFAPFRNEKIKNTRQWNQSAIVACRSAIDKIHDEKKAIEEEIKHLLVINEEKKKKIKKLQYIEMVLNVFCAYCKGVPVGVVLERYAEQKQEIVDLDYLFLANHVPKNASNEAIEASACISFIIGKDWIRSFTSSMNRYFIHGSFIKPLSPTEFSASLPGGKNIRFDKIHFFDYRDPSTKKSGNSDIVLLDFLKTRSIQ